MAFPQRMEGFPFTVSTFYAMLTRNGTSNFLPKVQKYFITTTTLSPPLPPKIESCLYISPNGINERKPAIG